MSFNISIGGGTVLFLIFLTLKLCKVISWSWWWVTSPLWLPLVLTLIVFGIVLLVAHIKVKLDDS
jgi:hypothetical protein